MPTDAFNWKSELDDWTRKAGLQQYLQSGLQDSTIGKSALFDLATQKGQEFREKELQGMQQAIGQAPMAGIDPAQAVAAEQAQSADAFQRREAMRNAGYGSAMSNQQSTTDWINQMMGTTSQLVNKNQQDWHNYQQALMNVEAMNAQGKNAMTGAYIGAGGAALGATAIII